MADDDVQLTDLEVIQRWSLAVRSASADRAEVVAALRADLAWLEGRRSAARSTVDADDDAPVRRSARRSAAPARKAPAKKAAAKSSTRGTSARGGTRRR